MVAPTYLGKSVLIEPGRTTFSIRDLAAMHVDAGVPA